MTEIHKQLYRILRGKPARPGNLDYLRNHRLAFIYAHAQVRLFYAMFFYFMTEGLKGISKWAPLQTLEYSWVLGWGNWIPQFWVMSIVLTLLVIAPILALIRPDKLLYRVLTFFAVLFYGGYLCSFGKVSHGQHAWVYIAFCFIFLPSLSWECIEKNRAARQRFLMCFSFAQFSFLGIYTCSGYTKLLHGFAQFWAGEPSIFSGNGFSYMIADTIMTNKMVGGFGPYLIDHPSISGPLLLLGALAELVAIAAVLRPEIHRFWGILFASFHLGTIVTLQVWYLEHVFPAIVLLVLSPFCCIKAHVSLRDRIIMLPGFNLAFRLMQGVQRRSVA
jgi:hypothetical protein